MNMINSNRYFEELPEDFELLLGGLGSEIRFKIGMLLIERGDLSLSKIAALAQKVRVRRNYSKLS
jgi:predicted HTH domain antitoxin